MRIDAAVFIPRTASPTPPPDADSWLAMETVCSLYRHAPSSSTPPGERAARALDEAGPALEATIARLALSPRAYGQLHDGERIPPQALATFHQTILKRDCLRGCVLIHEHQLAAALRNLVGLSPRWLNDADLLASIPPSLMSQLEKSLACILWPEAELPQNIGQLVLAASPAHLETALQRMASQWVHWSDHLRQQALPPTRLPEADAPPPYAATLLNTLENHPDPAIYLKRQLDLGGPILEDRLRGLVDAATRPPPNALALLSQTLIAREHARPNTATISALIRAIETEHTLPHDARARLLLPHKLLNQIARGLAGEDHTKPANGAALWSHLQQTAPHSARALLSSLRTVASTLTALADCAPALESALASMEGRLSGMDHASAADLAAAARQALRDQNSQVASGLRAKSLSDDLARARSKLGPALTDTPAAVYLAALVADAQRVARQAGSLCTELHALGLAAGAPLTQQLADALALGLPDRSQIARQIFQELGQLPEQDQQHWLGKSGLAENKLTDSARGHLARWRKQEPPLPALADVVERLSQLLRNRRTAPTQSEEPALLEQAMAEARREHQGNWRSAQKGQNRLQILLESIPKTGNAKSRNKAIGDHLQSLPPADLCSLMIEASHHLLNTTISRDLLNIQTPRKRLDSVAEQVMALTARRVGNAPIPLSLQDLHQLMHDPEHDRLLCQALGIQDTAKITPRLIASLDNLGLWSAAIGHATSAEERRNILARHIGPSAYDPGASDSFWNAQIRDTLRINSLTNYMDLREKLLTIPALGHYLLKTWQTTLDVFVARLDPQLGGLQALDPAQQKDNLARSVQSIKKQIQQRADVVLLMKAHSAEFSARLKELMYVAGHNASAPKRTNIAAYFAFEIASALAALR